MSSTTLNSDALAERLATSGLRSTQQRKVVYEVLLKKRDHPTADEVFARVRSEMPSMSLSLATVYNCLEMLVAVQPGPAGQFRARADPLLPESASARPFPRRNFRIHPRHRPARRDLARADPRRPAGGLRSEVDRDHLPRLRAKTINLATYPQPLPWPRSKSSTSTSPSAKRKSSKGCRSRSTAAKSTPSWGRTAPGKSTLSKAIIGHPDYVITERRRPAGRQVDAGDGARRARPRRALPRLPVPERDPRRQHRQLHPGRPAGPARRGRGTGRHAPITSGSTRRWTC